MTPGGVVECTDDESGPSEALVEEGLTREVFIGTSETSIGGFPCTSSTDLGAGNVIIAPGELALNASGKVEAPGMEVAANFSGGAGCQYEGARARGRMPIGPTPVALAIDFANVRLTLSKVNISSPICPRTAQLFTRFSQLGPQLVYVEN